MQENVQEARGVKNIPSDSVGFIKSRSRPDPRLLFSARTMSKISDLPTRISVLPQLNEALPSESDSRALLPILLSYGSVCNHSCFKTIHVALK